MAGAATLGALAQGAFFFVIQAVFPSLLDPGVPRSIPLIDILLTLVVIAAPRFTLLLWSQNSRRSVKASTAPQDQQRVLIVGAGEAGALILRELARQPADRPGPSRVHGRRSAQAGHADPARAGFGGREAIPALVRDCQVDQVIIAMPAAPARPCARSWISASRPACVPASSRGCTSC